MSPASTSINVRLAESAQWARAVLAGIWRRRWLGIGVAALVGVAGIALVSTVPDRYEATARLHVDTQTVLKPLMAGLTVQPDIDQQVRMLARTLVSRPNVERLMDKRELGLAPENPLDREATLTLLMKKIKVEPAGSGNLYAISFRDPDQRRAKRLVESLVELFMTSSGDEKRRDSEEAGRFINEQIQNYENKLVEAENRLKDFKLRHFGLSSTSNQDYFSRMSALLESVKKLQTDLHAAEQTRNAYQRELASEAPQLPPEAQALPAVQKTEAELRLDEHRRQLDELLRRYTEGHPDVISLRRVIGTLENQVRREAEIRVKADGDKGHGAASTSPVYQRIRISLAQAEADVAALRSRLAAEQSRLQEIRAMATRVPQVDAELAQLNRDYDVMRKNYEALVSRRETASLGVKLDESAQLAAFRLVEPPRVTPTPIRPTRFHLALGALFISVLAGLLAAQAANVLRPTFSDDKALAAFSGLRVIGTVPLFATPERLQHDRAENFKFMAVAMLLVTLQIGWVGWTYAGPRL